VKVYIETMGCQMNRLDTELVEGLLRAAGHEILPSRPAAHVVLYNTCSVRDHAEQKVHSRLGADAHRKSAGRPLLIGVLGCMAQRLQQQLLDRHKHVSLVCAPGRLKDLPALLEAAAAGERIVAVDPDRPKAHRLPDDWDGLDVARPADSSGGGAQAYVRITRGCDKFCTYCIVPFVRGPEVSRHPDHVAQEVRRLVEAGRSEITLLGQTVNGYLWSSGGRTVRFSDLLALLSPIPGLRRLRFVTSHPIDFGDDVLIAMRLLPNVCRYIHCPAQSGADAVLARMNRKYTRAQYDDLVDRAYALVPDVVLAGDFIVGFPGETELDHAASADLIRRSRYKNSFIFKYSPRPGTFAARKLPDDVPPAVKKRRNAELLAVQEQVGLAHHQSYLGRRVELLVAGRAPRAGRQPNPPPPGATQLLGRTRGDHIVVFDGPESLIGAYVNVTITNATDITLFGRRITTD